MREQSTCAGVGGIAIGDVREGDEVMEVVPATDGDGRTRVQLSDEDLREAYRWMILSRAVDQKAFNLQRQGRLGTFAPCAGQEATIVGVAMALRPDLDWVVPQYRELAAQLRQGWPLKDAFLFWAGHPDGWRPAPRILPVAIALAAQLPHAVGLAWGLRHRGSDAVVATFCGEGASSEGDFHEALNFAGVLRAPVVFVLQDNNWAISTPRSIQSAASSLADRAAGYGMAGTSVDGNDLFAVFEAASTAVARARSGEGPTLIEAKTYRLLAHNTVDDPTRYVDPDELAQAETRDPITRLRTHLREHDLLTEEQDEETAAEVQATIDTAVAEAEAHPAPRPAELFEHVYAERPDRLERQRVAAQQES
jgi:pyruvate dehydrogenase E1 component alpha subunit